MTEFISLITNLDGGDSPKITKNIFDKEFLINGQDDYNNIYNYSLINTKDKQVYITKDLNNLMPVISGINEKYMFRNNDEFNSKLKILFFSNYHEIEDSNINSINSQLLGWTKSTFENHKLTLKPEQIVLIGLNDIDFDLETEELDNLNIEYYTLSTIKKKGLNMIIDKILEENNNNKILSIFNLEVFNKKITPSVNRRNFNYELLAADNEKNINNGLSYENLEEVSLLLKDKVNYLLVSGLDKRINNERK